MGGVNATQWGGSGRAVRGVVYRKEADRREVDVGGGRLRVAVGEGRVEKTRKHDVDYGVFADAAANGRGG